MRLFGLDIRRAQEPERRASLEDPRVPVSDTEGMKSLFGISDWMAAAGMPVTPDTVMGIPAWAAGVNFLARTIASLPLQEFKKTAEGRERVETGTLAGILKGTVNDDFLTSYRWREDMIRSAFLTGAGRTWCEKNAAGGVVNLWPLETRQTEKRRVGGRTRFDYRDGRGVLPYPVADVVDVAWAYKLDGVSVFNPVERFKETFGLALAIERYGAALFRNGGVPPLALEAPVGSPAALARAKTDTDQAIRGANKRGDPILFMPVGAVLKQIGFDPEKAQMVEVKRFLVEEFARMLNLPPVFLQDLSHGTFSNTEQQDLQLVKHTVLHWSSQIEAELNAKFYGPRGSTKYVEFNLDGLQRGDMKSRVEAFARGIQTGQIMPSEVRGLENRPFVEGSDKLFIQGATVPIDKAGTMPATAPAPGAADGGDPLDPQQESQDA